MYYKQLTSGNQLIAIGEAPDDIVLPKYFVQITKSEFDSFKNILTMNNLEKPELTPINEKGELIYASI